MPNFSSVDIDTALRDLSTLEFRGRITQALGTTVTVTGLPVAIGQRCRILGSNANSKGSNSNFTVSQSDESILAEVVGFSGDDAVLFPLGDIRGITLGSEVVIEANQVSVSVSEQMLGQVHNGFGARLTDDPFSIVSAHTLTNTGNAGHWSKLVPVRRVAPEPLQRQRVSELLSTGIKSIDSLLSVGIGQRLGIFAPAGAGKSTLLGQLSRSSPCDVVVIALIGERGREVREFLEDTLDEDTRAKSVLVVATSDRPAMERINAAYTATAIAEGFAESGKRVLLLMDSVTRFARAVREVGLAAGEPAVRQGFTPSVFSELPRLFERAGATPVGSITAFYTVLTEDESADDVIAEETRSLLDGNIVLSRSLAQRAQFPAIDIAASISRCMNGLVESRHIGLANDVRTSIEKYQQLEFMVQVGEYEMGNDPKGDKAVMLHSATEQWLAQDTDSWIKLDDALNQLEQMGFSASMVAS